MIVYPNAKINLGLNIIAKREDGFHDIETCFVPVSICDILEFIETEGGTSFSTSGLSIPGNPSDKNICVQAWELIHKDFPVPNIKIHLHKVIPIGAGLGGGSSDGAFMLKALNSHFKLNISFDKLLEYALTLGSDCPFFLINKPAIGVGRGNILKPFPLPMDSYKMVLVNPGIHVSTGVAYSSVIPKKPDISLEHSLNGPVDTWMGQIQNDFEPHVFEIYPEIGQVKEKLLGMGAVYAAMSGSGSTVFGIFRDSIPQHIESHFKHAFVYCEK